MSNWPKMKEVTEDEFCNFVLSYPRKLEKDVFGAAEPPLVTLNDFTRAPKWPASVVASYFMGSGYDNSGPNGWKILEEENS